MCLLHIKLPLCDSHLLISKKKTCDRHISVQEIFEKKFLDKKSKPYAHCQVTHKERVIFFCYKQLTFFLHTLSVLAGGLFPCPHPQGRASVCVSLFHRIKLHPPDILLTCLAFSQAPNSTVTHYIITRRARSSIKRTDSHGL